MTAEALSNYIHEELSTFSSNEKEVLLFQFKKLIPHIISVSQSESNQLPNNLLLLHDSYRKILQATPDLFISIHLFALIIFSAFETEALNIKRDELANIWSSVSEEIIKISLEENER